MKIVKEFIDTEFYSTHSTRGLHWYWGLGDDGELYCKKIYEEELVMDWVEYSMVLVPKSLSIKQIVKIAKEFGHLVAFI